MLEDRCLAEREHCHHAEFHKLVPERDTYDGDAEKQSDDDIPHPEQEASEDEPYNIPQ